MIINDGFVCRAAIWSTYAALAKLWELGTASARDIHGHIGEPAGLVYTTTAKVLDRVHDKGLVTRERRGKACIQLSRESCP